MPTSHAATYASAPMLIGSTVPTTNSATSARIATHSGPMIVPPVVPGTAGPGVTVVTCLAQWPSQ